MTVRRAALVTGASRGIGRAIAQRLAAEGFDLTVSARADGPLKDTAHQLRAHGTRVETVPERVDPMTATPRTPVSSAISSSTSLQ